MKQSVYPYIMVLSMPRLIMWIAVTAILFRSIVPMGYMPEIDTGKVFHMTICTMEGPKDIALDSKGQPVTDTTHQAKEKCAFSVLNHSPFNTDVATTFVAVPYVTSAMQRLVFKDHVVRHSTLYSIAQPRGPPALI